MDEDGRVEISKIHLSTFLSLSLSLCLGSFIPVFIYPSGRIRGIFFFFSPPSGYIDRFSVIYRSRIMRRDDE